MFQNNGKIETHIKSFDVDFSVKLPHVHVYTQAIHNLIEMTYPNIKMFMVLC